MDFAKKQLEKYGWSEGKALGKNDRGLKSAIKPSLKFDSTGLGYDPGTEFTNNWWDNIYNKASQNIKVTNANDEVNMTLVGNSSIEVTNKDYSINDLKNSGNKYNNFVKSGHAVTSNLKDFSSNVSDEDLFKACGKRTAHKGARHGVKQSGKLARIEKQEKMLLKRMENCSISSNEALLKFEKRLKKLTKAKSSKEVTEQPNKKKKRKKKKKTVSFNPTVIEYHHCDLDLSSQSNDSVDPVIVETEIIDKSDCIAVVPPEPSFKIYEDEADEVEEADNSKRKMEIAMEDDNPTNKKLCKDIDKIICKKKKRKKKKGIITSISDSLSLNCKISDNNT